MDHVNHIVYASDGNIKQIFRELYGDIGEVEVGSGQESTQSVAAGLRAFIGSFGVESSETESSEVIKRINFDDSEFQRKKVINRMLEDDEIPSVEKLGTQDEISSRLFKFSSDVALSRVRDEDLDRKYIEVNGYQGKVKFQGKTSMKNWTSRSDVLTALDADVPYPFKGVLTPVSVEDHIISGEDIREITYNVNYLFICSADGEDYEDWSNRQILRRNL